MKNKNKTIKRRSGLTLIELVMAAVIGVMISLIIGMLLYAGQRNWVKTFDRSNKGIEVDALQTMIAFGSTGRKSNKMDYRLYVVDHGRFTQSMPSTSLPAAGQVVAGDAVEFRYWDSELDASMMDTSKTATSYALFYLQDGKLMVDRGPYVTGGSGGVDNAGNRISGGSVTTQLLAEHVAHLQFSHTVINTNGDGNGSVRMDIDFVDNDTNRSITIKTATLMRNVWGQSPH